jgi:putative DNA primase/helicase
MTAEGLANLGIRLKNPQRLGEHRTRCPWCDRSGYDDALAVKVEPGGGATWFCHRCEASGGFKGDGEITSRSGQAPAAEPERRADLAPYWRELWAEKCRPIWSDTPVAAYLRRRGCILPPWPDESDLRWLPDHRHPSGYRGPALVALITDIATCEPISIHRTWLAPAGRGKAKIEKPRLLLKGHRSDGVVRLWPDAEGTYGLVIGEGIETCLAAAAAGLTPMWACLSARTMKRFPVLQGLEHLTILVDHDQAGIEAAHEVIDRYAEAGFDPESDLGVIFPETAGMDAADLAIVS